MSHLSGQHVMLDLHKPPAVRPGDCVGLVSTSSPVTPEQLGRLTRYIEGRGYRVKCADGVLARTGYLAGPVQQRAAGVSAMFADPDVALVLPVNGGTGAGHLVDRVDYRPVRARPKVFSAFSNPSVLNLALLAEAGVPSVHGVSGFDFFGWDDVDDPTQADFWRLLGGPIAGTEVEDQGWRGYRLEGSAVAGPAIGGNLSELTCLAGTRWMPSTEGALLLIESMARSYESVDRMLTHLRLAGVFESIAGLIVGAPADWDVGDAAEQGTDELVLRCVGGKFPVVAGINFGHQQRKLQLPIGCRVEFDLDGDRSVLRYLEDLVASR